MTSRTLTVTIRIPLPTPAALRGAVAQFPARLETWRMRAVTRRQLADLDESRRRDLGPAPGPGPVLGGHPPGVRQAVLAAVRLDDGRCGAGVDRRAPTPYSLCCTAMQGQDPIGWTHLIGDFCPVLKG